MTPILLGYLTVILPWVDWRVEAFAGCVSIAVSAERLYHPTPFLMPRMAL